MASAATELSKGHHGPASTAPDGRASAASSDEERRIAGAFARQTARAVGSALTDACVDLLDVTAAGLTIMGGGQSGPLSMSGAAVARLDDLQYLTGEGPCHDAFRSRSVVSAPSLDDGAAIRWPSFVGMARRAGFGAVFALPLSAPDATIGVLSLYCRRAGDLTGEQLRDGVALSEVLTATV